MNALSQFHIQLQMKSKSLSILPSSYNLKYAVGQVMDHIKSKTANLGILCLGADIAFDFMFEYASEHGLPFSQLAAVNAEKINELTEKVLKRSMR